MPRVSTVLVLALVAPAGCSFIHAPGGHPRDGSPVPATAPKQRGGGQGGTLTAALWDDNLNFDFYLHYLQETERTQRPGLVMIPRGDRVTIHVTADGRPVAGAEVAVSAGNGRSVSSLTGADGRVLYFPGWAGAHPHDTLRVSARWGDRRAEVTAPARAGAVAVELPGASAAPVSALDLMFVVDTTGSMGDEIEYLQAELDDLARSIGVQVKTRWSLVLYRDEGDDYVVRPLDFVSDLSRFRRSLQEQSAGGGGDYPEAPDQALAAATAQSWRPGATARVLFWVTDAPHHAGREQAMAASYAQAIGKGIHIYPVAASGTDDVTEHAMRTAAQVTGGRYLFLTDDSGVGLSHQEPHVPCYLVTSFLAAMRRVVNGELTGIHAEPAPGEVIRAGGNPQDRTCRLDNGQTVTAF